MAIIIICYLMPIIIIILLLSPFTNIDRRQPIMDNYIHNNMDNYMLGSPYI